MAMGTRELTPDEVVERGKAIYEQSIRTQVEADNIGSLLMIDVVTGNWVLGDDRIKMARHLRQQNPDADNYALRVGYPTAEKIGSWPFLPGQSGTRR
jgi:hypothetical protein